jgi:hypothetical protein
MTIIILTILIIYSGILIRHRFKPMPPGTDYESRVCFVDPEDVMFFYDLRFENEKGSIFLRTEFIRKYSCP